MTIRKTFACLAAAFLAASALTVSAAETGEPPSEALGDAIRASLAKTPNPGFPIGRDNVLYAPYFSGKTFLAPMTPAGVNISAANVTFEPGAITRWHTHQKSCQVLVTVAGSGWYQIWGEKPVKLRPGMVAAIPENVKHWHGAAKDSWFQHLSVMTAGSGTTWLEPVDPKVYAALKD